MTETLNIIGIALFASSLLVLVAFRVRPERPSQTTRAKHRRDVQQCISNAAGQELRIDWMSYRGVPKERIVALANKHGWYHIDDDISGRSWFLEFNKDHHSAVRSAQVNEPSERLASELATATPDAKGRYVLDTSKYAELSETLIEQAVISAGWQTVHTSYNDLLVIARPSTTTAEFESGPFLDGESPETLRSDAAVMDRAHVIKQMKGFDPLSEHELNRARERNEYWSKPFARQVRLVFFYAILGMSMLGITLSVGIPDDHPAKWAVPVTTVVVFALLAIAVTKARIIRKKRSSEIGDVITAYRELQEIYRREH